VKSQYPIPKIRTLLARGCRKKCPQCGKGDLYKSWSKLQDQCPVCGLCYLPNQGDLLGPLLFFDRLLFLIPLILVVYFWRFGSNVFSLLMFGGAILFLLVFTLPHRNGMSVAIDYLVRRKAGDLSDDEPEI
jgi:uncharacterized protein (DUF983 family)